MFLYGSIHYSFQQKKFLLDTDNCYEEKKAGKINGVLDKKWGDYFNDKARGHLSQVLRDTGGQDINISIEKNIPGRGNSKCKSYEGGCLDCLSKNR